MFSRVRRLQRKDEPTRTEDITRWNESTAIATSTGDSSGQSSSTSAVQRRRTEPIIRCPDDIRAVAFLIDGEHVVSGDGSGRIRCWRVDDGSEVGAPMDAGSCVRSIAVSRDGRWIVCGTLGGEVQLWNAETRNKVREIQKHRKLVWAVDISPDGTKIATGSDDLTACVWSRSTGDLLLGPWEYDSEITVGAAKFSPDSRLVAIATYQHSVRVYDQDGGPLFGVTIQVASYRNNSLTWYNEKQLFVLASDGNIHSLDASTGTTIVKWAIHTSLNARCIALASNGRFIAASADRLVSFWDTTTHQQVGSLVHRLLVANFLAMSDNHDLAAVGDMPDVAVVSMLNLGDILPPFYTQDLAIVRAERIIRELRNAQHAAEEQDNSLHDENMQLNELNRKLRRDLARSERAVDEQVAQTELLRSRQTRANDEITQLKQANEALRCELAKSRRAVDENVGQTESLRSQLIKANDEIAQLKRVNQCVIHLHAQRCQFEALYAQGRPVDAARKLLEIESSASEHIQGNEFLSGWLTASVSKCSKTLETNGDDASNAGKHEEAVTAYAAVLSLGPLNSAVLAKWASAALTNCTVHETLQASVEFKASKPAVYRVVCNVLEEVGRISEAAETFRKMMNDLRDTNASDGPTHWEHDFRERCAKKMVNFGDTARDSEKHKEAIQYYSDAISLDPTNINEILLKRGNEFITLDSSSHNGYEDKHRALHGMGHYREAFQVFQAMLSIFGCSRDPKIRGLRDQFVDATSAIRNVVEDVIRHLPTVLIDTDTGLLCNKKQQAAAFEELPIYDELRSSMTTVLDHSRIRKEVTGFYRYVMFSHKWQPDEPTFQQVENDSVYRLPSSPTFDKLRNFCKLVVVLQLRWAWSDTCCVNQLDRGVQQESIVAMFRWYRCSFLTVVSLLGVLSESQEPGCLWKSIWNTRGWTYQEYVASEVVQFYTEDWKPYLGLQMFNHKESPAVLSEMERATSVTAQQLMILQPGLDRAREKLYLASQRQTTREEDMAYSLFGIFGVALPVVYGEGNLAISRLLEHILTRSDEVTLLAWTGHSGSLHSYLPASLTVYNEIVPLHVPTPVETSEMDRAVLALRSSIPDISLVIDLYERLHDLPSLSLLAGRLRLPGIVFKHDGLSPLSESDTETNIHVYHMTMPLLGDVEIKTTADLSEMRGLRLIYPWISPLIDLDFSFDDALFDLPTRALRLLVRLRQPFGGLLLTSSGRSQYRRVATDCLIMARIREEAPLSELLDAVHTVQVQ